MPTQIFSKQAYFIIMKIIRNNIIPFPGYKAINLFGVLFVRNSARISDIDINHEAIHSEQIKEMLYIFFYIWYVIEWIILCIKYLDYNKAYKNIRFEKEAYNNENNLEYIKDRKRYNYLWKN